MAGSAKKKVGGVNIQSKTKNMKDKKDGKKIKHETDFMVLKG